MTQSAAVLLAELMTIMMCVGWNHQGAESEGPTHLVSPCLVTTINQMPCLKKKAGLEQVYGRTVISEPAMMNCDEEEEEDNL